MCDTPEKLKLSINNKMDQAYQKHLSKHKILFTAEFKVSKKVVLRNFVGF